MAINCFDNINIPELKEAFNNAVDDSMSEGEQKAIAVDLIIQHYQNLSAKLNELKSDLKLPKSIDVEGEKAKKLTSIKEEYKKKIDDLQTRIVIKNISDDEFSRVGGLSQQTTKALMEDITSRIMNSFFGEKATLSLANLSDNKEIKLGEYYDAIKPKLKQNYLFLAQQYQKQGAITVALSFGKLAVAVDKNWNDIVALNTEQLKVFRIARKQGEEKGLISDNQEGEYSEDEQLSEDGEQTFEKENKSQQEYDRDIFTISGPKNASAGMRLLLSTIKDAFFPHSEGNEFSIIPQIEFKKSLTQGAKLLNYTKTFNQVANALVNTNKLSGLMKKLVKFSKQNAPIAGLFMKLKGNMTNGQINYANLSYNEWRLLLDFAKTFSKQSPQALVQINDGNVSQLLPGNEQSAIRQIANNFIRNVKSNEEVFLYQKANKSYVINKELYKKFPSIVAPLDKVKFINAIGFKNLSGEQFTLQDLKRVKNIKAFNDAIVRVYNSLKNQKAIFDTTTKSLQLRDRINTIAEGIISATKDDGMNTFLNIKGKQVQSVVLPSPISNFLNSFNEAASLTELYNEEKGLQEGFSENSITLEKGGKFIKEDGGRTAETIEVGWFDGMKTPKTVRQSSKLSLIQRRLSAFNLNINGWFVPITNGDKKTEWVLSMDNPISLQTVTTNSHWDRTYSIFQNYLRTEINVAKTDITKNLKALDKNDRRGKLRFFLDILPEKLVNEAHELIKANKSADEFITRHIEEINLAVKKFIEKETNKTKTEFTQYGVIHIADKEGVYSFDGIEEGYLYKINENGNNKWTGKQIDDTLLYRTLNQIINNIEIHKLFLGDPAFMTDAVKRIPGAYSGVNQSAYGDLAYNTYLSTVLNRVDVHAPSITLSNSDYGYTSMKDTLSIVVSGDVIVKGTTSDKYKNTNEADGFSKITLPAYRGFKTRTAEWTDEQEAGYQYEMAFLRRRANNEWGYKYSSEELKAHDKEILLKGQPENYQFEILKPKGWGQNQNSNYKDNVFLKTATQPLIPTAITKGSNDELLMRKMLDEKVDVMAFESAIKLGARTLHSFYNEKGEFNEEKYPANGILNPSWRDMGIQVETQFSQGKKTVTLGSQLSTLATLNLLSNGVPSEFMPEYWNSLTEEQKIEKSPAYKELKHNNYLLKKLTDNGYNNLLRKLGITETKHSYQIKDHKKLLNYLLEQARDLDDNTIAALKLDDVTKKLKTPLEAIPSYTQLKNILYAIVDKNIASPKMGGAGLVQAPNTGRETGARPEMGPNTTNKFYTKEEPWSEVKVAAWFLDQIKAKYQKKGLPTPDRKEVFKMAEKAGILDFIGFRIPTEELNSMETGKINEFLSPVEGNTAIVPSEITKKSDSDFDIDKLNLYLKNVYIDGKGQIRKYEFQEPKTEAQLKAFYEDFLLEKYKTYKEQEKATATRLSVDLLFKQAEVDESQEEEIVDELESKYIPTLEEFLLEAKDLTMEELNEKYLPGYRKALENEYYSSLQRLLQLPQNYERLIKSEGTDTIDNITYKFNRALYTEKEIKDLGIDVGDDTYLSYLSILSPNSLDEIRHYQVTGKDGVGIAASAQKSNSILQRLPVVLDISRANLLLTEMGVRDDLRINLLGDGVIRFPHNTYDGKPTVSNAKTKDGKKYISDIISQFVKSFTDIAKKNGLIIKAGVNIKTAGTFLFMERLGNDTEHTFYFMNQPIIREYLKNLDKGGFSGIRNKMIIKDIGIKWGIEGKAYTEKEILPNSLKLLDNIKYFRDKNRDMNNLSQQFIDEQAAIFIEFLKYQEMASDLFTLMQGINWDTAHMSDPELFLFKDVKYDKANNTIFTPASEILKHVFIGDVKDNLMKSRDAIGSFISIEHPRVRSILDELKRKLINPSFFQSPDDYSKAAKRVNNAFINYIMQVKGKITPALLNSVLLDTTQGAATMLEQAQSSIPKGSDLGQILSQFSVIKDGPEANSIKAIAFRKSGTDAADRNSDIDNFRILKENQHTYELYKRLVAASLLQTGVQYTRTSFSHLIPNEDYAAVLEDVMKQLPEYADLRNFLTIDAFARNNWKTNGVIPSVMVRKKLIRDYSDDGGGIWSANFSLPKKLGHLPKGSIYNSIFFEGEYVKYQPKNTEGTFKYYPDDNSLFHGPTAYKSGDSKLNKTYLYKIVRDENGEPVTATEGEYTKYIYRAINALGNGELAQEFYENPQTNRHEGKAYLGASKIANNTYDVDEGIVNEQSVLLALGTKIADFEQLKNQLPKKDCP